MKTRFICSVILFFLLFNSLKGQLYSGFEKDIEQYAKHLGLPALAVGVAQGDRLIFFKGIGSAKPGINDPITEDHIFTIASVTKTFTSVVLQQMEEERKLSLNDRVDAFPNQYFNTNRWDANTTLAHVISHTSESDPIGVNFAYNGSKFNLVYNAFAKLNPVRNSEAVTRPFTREVEQRILKKLKMDHTLVRYDPEKHAHLDPWVVVPYEFNDSLKEYLPVPINLNTIESGPAYGMMSSTRDLVKYSRGLSGRELLPEKRYKRITSPFYPESPQGMGWFTREFEGVDMHWAYGYGFNDSAIFLRIPSRDLTFIMLAPSTVPSASSQLGYGNPLNAPLVASFMRNFVLHAPGASPLYRGVRQLNHFVLNKEKQPRGAIYSEEALSMATLFMLAPTSGIKEREKGVEILKWLSEQVPHDPIWDTTTAIELLAVSGERSLLKFGSGILSNYADLKQMHPSRLYFVGRIEENLGNRNRAMELYKELAVGTSYREQGVKFDAMMKLIEFYRTSEPELSKKYAEQLIKYKEYIGVQDAQYREAKQIYSGL